MLHPICQNLGKLDVDCRHVINLLFNLHQDMVAYEIPLTASYRPAEQFFHCNVVSWGWSDITTNDYAFLGRDNFAIVHADSPAWRDVAAALRFDVSIFFHAVLSSMPWLTDHSNIISQALALNMSFDEFFCLFSIIREDPLEYSKLRFLDIEEEMQVSSYY